MDATYNSPMHRQALQMAPGASTHRQTFPSSHSFSSSAYRQSPALYDTYPHAVYPESSQRTATALAASMGTTADASGSFDGLSHFSRRHGHYAAEFDYDPAHFSEALSANGRLYGRYGVSSLRNTPGADRRSPSLSPLLTGPSDGGSSHSSTSPFYSPAPLHAMSSYPGASSASVFPEPSRDPRFSVLPSGGLGYPDRHSQHHVPLQRPPAAPPSLGTSIPMSKVPADWKTTPGLDEAGGEYISSSSSSSSVLLPLSARAVVPHPYGSVDRRSPSSTPPLDSVRADPATRSGSHSALSRQDIDLLTSSKRSSTLRDNGAGGSGPPKQQQPPLKKKKKSKMHSCEICSKKFPRPSGLRTHMNTHNNARPYACGFPGCSRTFGVRSNAKRHLRTHGIIPPPSVPNHGGVDAPYVVGFSPPVIAPASADGPSAGLLDDGSPSDGSLEGQATHRLTRAPFFKLRWMPPSLTTRTNAAKLKPVDEATGEVSDDEMDSEEGDDDSHGSDRDDPDAGGGSGKVLLSPLGNISLPTLVPLDGRSSLSTALSSSSTPSTTSHHQSNPYPYSSTNQSCICPFSNCLSSPCRSLNGEGVPETASSTYSSVPPAPLNMDHTFTMGGYATSAGTSSASGMSSMGSTANMSYSGMGYSAGNSLYGVGESHRLTTITTF